MSDCPKDMQLPVLTPEEAGRRRFLVRTSIGLTGLIGAIIAAPALGFVFAPLARRITPQWRNVCKVGDVRIGETVLVEFEDTSSLPWSGVTARSAAWLRRETETTFIAFSVNCRHLGCPVRWVPDAEMFLCPCHGGVYYADGSVAAGPPPEPLKRLQVRVVDGGVEVLAEPIPLTK